MDEIQMKLEDEIKARKSEIHTDQYPVSINELVGMYDNDELDIKPIFQRNFRWGSEQKTKFIESLFLGIPIPSIFVAQNESGVWEVVDGHQRISTIFEFFGILKDENSKVLPALELVQSGYLPSLDGMTWKRLSIPQQLYLKRSKLDVKIILRESHSGAKFELFQRLNTGGLSLSYQEIRNSAIQSINPEFYNWLKDLCGNADFKKCVTSNLSKNQINESLDHDLILRFFIFKDVSEQELSSLIDLNEYITKKSIEMSGRDSSWRQNQKIIFDKSFKEITGISNVFSSTKGSRKFTISNYEAVVLGVGYFYSNNSGSTRIKDLDKKLSSLKSNEEFIKSSGMGVRASTRIKAIIKISRIIFRK